MGECPPTGTGCPGLRRCDRRQSARFMVSSVPARRSQHVRDAAISAAMINEMAGLAAGPGPSAASTRASITTSSACGRCGTPGLIRRTRWLPPCIFPGCVGRRHAGCGADRRQGSPGSASMGPQQDHPGITCGSHRGSAARHRFGQHKSRRKASRMQPSCTHLGPSTRCWLTITVRATRGGWPRFSVACDVPAMPASALRRRVRAGRPRPAGTAGCGCAPGRCHRSVARRRDYRPSVPGPRAGGTRRRRRGDSAGPGHGAGYRQGRASCEIHSRRQQSACRCSTRAPHGSASWSSTCSGSVSSPRRTTLCCEILFVSSALLRGRLDLMCAFYRRLFAEFVGRAELLRIHKSIQGAVNNCATAAAWACRSFSIRTAQKRISRSGRRVCRLPRAADPHRRRGAVRRAEPVPRRPN